MIRRHDPGAYYASPFVRWLEGFRIRAILRELKATRKGRFLEIGCGFGFVLEKIDIRSGFARCAGLDLSRPSLKAARGRLGSTLPLIEGDAMALPFRNGTFDAVLLTEVIEHVPDPVAVLKEAARVIAPGGVLLVTAPNEAMINRLKIVLRKTGLWRLFFSRYDAADHMEDEWHLHLVTPNLLSRWIREAGISQPRQRMVPFPFLPLRNIATAKIGSATESGTNANSD